MQNTILSLIDNVDQASAFAEYEVLSSLLDTYTKSMMISESVDITQEASLGIEINSPLTGRYDESKLKKILMFIPRLLASVIRAVVYGVVHAVLGIIAGLTPDGRGGAVYSPVNIWRLDELILLTDIWIDDLYAASDNAMNDAGPEENGIYRYVDYMIDFITKPTNGHKLKWSESLPDEAKISMAEETDDLVNILKHFEVGGDCHKVLFTVTCTNPESLPGVKSRIKGLQRSAKDLIHSLNRASRYVNGLKGGVREDEIDKAAELRKILPQFRSNIAYIMNFFTKITTQINEAIQKQKKRIDDATAMMYDADEFDDDNSEEGNNEN